MEWINNIIYWHWLILAVALIILEILMPGAYFLWMGVSAAAVGCAMFIFPEMPWLTQILIFAALSVITVVIYKTHQKKNPIVTDEPALNRRGEQYIGRTSIRCSSPRKRQHIGTNVVPNHNSVVSNNLCRV